MSKATESPNTTEQPAGIPPTSRRSAILAALGITAAMVTTASPLPVGAEVRQNTQFNLYDWEAFDLPMHIAAINHHLDPNGWCSLGERVAAAINCKSKTELVAMARGLDDESGDELVEFLTKAEAFLASRHALVQCALARLAHVTKEVG